MRILFRQLLVNLTLLKLLFKLKSHGKAEAEVLPANRAEVGCVLAAKLEAGGLELLVGSPTLGRCGRCGDAGKGRVHQTLPAHVADGAVLASVFTSSLKTQHM